MFVFKCNNKYCLQHFLIILGNLYTKQYYYLQKGDQTSNLIASEWFGKDGKLKDNLKYKYDINGNITNILENGIEIARYTYDSLSRLIREDNKNLNKTTLFEYDGGGNLLNKRVFNYTTNEINELGSGTVIPYVYPTTGWRDQLASYNGQAIIYDNVGNPTIYRGKSLSWSHNRQLDRYDNTTFAYNAEGVRISKTYNNITTNYYLEGTKLVAQSNGNTLIFHYGMEGVVGFTYQGVGEYYYKKNILGDVIGIIDSNGQEVAKYEYDAWGNHKVYAIINGNIVDITNDTSYNNHIAKINPFRYRSYYYDNETGLYYLNSRYYDPETGRFINADDISILLEGKDIINGLNLYAYCGNNPIMNTDQSGESFWDWLWKAALAIVIVVAIGVAAVFTGGTAGVILGAAFYGAIAGGISTAVVGGVVGAISNGWTGFVNGFADGLLAGVVIGGATGAISAGINIATGAAKIVGSAQKTHTFFHRMASNIQAGKMAMQIGRYSQITLDRSLNSAGLIGRKMPDVIGTARWGKNLLVEVTSKSQTYLQMETKLKSLVEINLNSKYKIINWAAWISKIFM